MIEKPLESLDDIEIALVKMHEDSIDDMEGEGEVFQALVGSDCEEIEINPDIAGNFE